MGYLKGCSPESFLWHNTSLVLLRVRWSGDTEDRQHRDPNVLNMWI